MPRLVLCLAFTLTLTLTLKADNWPQWRGIKNDGHTAEKNLPTEFGPEKNVIWKLKLPGIGESTPCIWGDRMFFTCVDGDNIVLMCVGTDGKEKWRDLLADSGKERANPDKASNASASCSTDGKLVWSYVGGKSTGRLSCHDVSGKRVWEKNINDYGKIDIAFGSHWTPVLYQGVLYLQVMHRKAQMLVALEAATGKEKWKVERPGYSKGESPDVYASAFIWEGEGGPLLVAHGNDFCTGHKLTDGTEVWRVTGLNPKASTAWRFISCPMLSPDLIVVPSCKDGPTVAFNPVGAKGEINPENKAELWRITSGETRTPDVVTPLRDGDIVYICADGPLTALDAKTGKQIYRKDLAKQIHRSQMVTGDGKLYVVAREGAVDVVQTGKEFKLLSSAQFPDRFFATPAISDGRIYLRGYDFLWAIGSK